MALHVVLPLYHGNSSVQNYVTKYRIMEDLYKPEVEVDAEDQEENKLQNSLFINRFLPYNSALEKEAEELLEEIKINLSHAIQLYELWPGALYWTNRLRR